MLSSPKTTLLNIYAHGMASPPEFRMPSMHMGWQIPQSSGCPTDTWDGESPGAPDAVLRGHRSRLEPIPVSTGHSPGRSGLGVPVALDALPVLPVLQGPARISWAAARVRVRSVAEDDVVVPASTVGEEQHQRQAPVPAFLASDTETKAAAGTPFEVPPAEGIMQLLQVLLEPI